MQERGAPGSSPLHVGILADTIGRPGGIGRYTSELVAALGRRDDVRMIVAAPTAALDRVHELAGRNLHATVPIPTGARWALRSGSDSAAAPRW